VVTVNDYLAKRDSDGGQIYNFLGLKVGVIVHGMGRRAAQGRPMTPDVTYGTNNELGFGLPARQP